VLCSRQQLHRYCARHAAERDDVVHLCAAYCIAPGCLKQPTFARAGESQALYCTEHAREQSISGLVNVIAKTCEVASCSKQPSYGFSDDKIRRRCKAHSLPGMTNVLRPLCEGCNKRISRVGYKFDNDRVSLAHI
jgi:5-methylcytosine-specific restriction endonuclease McrA